MTMPVIIKNLEDDEATILMVDANIQREDILPSERAFALQMKMKARKHQGERNDLSCGTEFHKSTSEEIGKEEGMSGRQVRQYVRLTKLLPGKVGLLSMKCRLTERQYRADMTSFKRA